MEHLVFRLSAEVQRGQVCILANIVRELLYSLAMYTCLLYLIVWQSLHVLYLKQLSGDVSGFG